MSIRNGDGIGNVVKLFKSPDEEKDKRCETKHGEENNLSRDVINQQGSSPAVEAGSYYLGPILNKYVRTPVTQCLARKKGTDEYYLMKILILKDGNLKDKLHLHHRTVFHAEYTILSLLKGHPGVIQIQDFFKDRVPDVGQLEDSGAELKRICMVLECLIPHGCHNGEMIPLAHYLKEKRRLCEAEALHIFMNILLVIEDLHKRNIVHNDLNLSNIILNRRTLKVKLINFYYAKLLTSEYDVSHGQPGAPTYLPADKPVSFKPYDMWSTGVSLNSMLHGYLPFIGNPNWGSALANTRSLADLYIKIINNDYAISAISDDICVSDGTKKLIRSLLCKDPQARLKASEAVDMVSTLLALQSSSQNRNIIGSCQSSDQIVPECPKFEERESSPPTCTECWLIVNANVPNVTSKTYKIAISEVDTKSPKNGSKHKTSGKSSARMNQDQTLMNCEKELLSRSTSTQGKSNSNLISRRNSMSRNSKIKFAMLRLGATSVNNIAALSFNYCDKNTSRSQL